MIQSAKVYLVGTGPGDPELLTVKALRLLQTADVVIYDRLVSEAILQQIPSGVSRIYAGKKSGNHALPQDEINQLLVTLVKSQRSIVRLKGGDPFIFGRGSEEALVLTKHGIEFEIVPGITAASACASYAGIPLTHRGLAQGVQIITGHSQAGQELDLNWNAIANAETTIVIYMGLHNIDLICTKLIAAGLDIHTPAAAIKNGTTCHQQLVITTLSKLASVVRFTFKNPPVIFIIGKVVSLSNSLDWFLPEDAIRPKDDYFGISNQSQHA